MFYENELRFFCDTLKKARIPVSFIDSKESLDAVSDDLFKNLFGTPAESPDSFYTAFEKANPYTIYKLTNSFKLCFVFFLLPHLPKRTFLLIGPYLSEPINELQVLELGERYGVSPQGQRLLGRYYVNTPVLPITSPIFIMMDTLGERMWGGGSAFSVVDLNRELISDAPVLSKHSGYSAGDVLASMELMERRYALENELIRAVAQGHARKAPLLSNIAADIAASSEQRLSDPMRNLKNYCIIFNTLLRKAAESGGVHPLYLHETSSLFASKIEQQSTPQDVQELMEDMFLAYCRLVRKHAMNHYSPAVQKVITVIQADLSADLSLSALARSQNLSPGYLSTLFKKETGKTITDFVIHERIQNAMHLLSTTSLQIQSVAQHCGIIDVQYFSKVFKKYTGKTPKDYQKSVKE